MLVAGSTPGPCAQASAAENGDGGQALGLQERHQPGQLAMVLGQVVAQAVPQLQVVAGRVGQGAHRAAPGQGWATVRKVAKSTLA